MADKTGARHGFRARFLAWWEGYELLPAAAGTPEAGAAARPDGGASDGAAPPSGRPGPGTDRRGRPLWSATRIEVAEKLWGPGFTQPGGADHISYITKPMGLNQASSVLVLAAGLGGAARAIAKEHGCWVAAFEGSELLAREGMARSVKEGLDKRAPIEHYDPEHFAYPKRVDGVLYKEGLFAVHDKDQFFDALEPMVKPRGHILITDYVLVAGHDAAAVARWAEAEPLEPTLWTVERMQDAYAQRNLDLRISEDITDTHRSLILRGAQDLAAHLARHSVDAPTRTAVLSEVELWARRVAAFDAGLRCYRFYAIKAGE